MVPLNLHPTRDGWYALRNRWHFAFLLVTAVAIAACDSYPRDPLSSLQEAKTDGLRVGVMHAPPWAEFDEGEVSGREVDLIKGFAESIGANVEWVEGSGDALLRSLEADEVHLVIGGLTEKTPWKKHVGLTNPYLEEGVVVCSTESELVPRKIKGLPVAVKRGSAAVAEVKKKDGIPVPVKSIESYQGLVAVSELSISKVGCLSDTTRIATRRHVMAVPKGENALLMALEEYLDAAGY